MNTLILRVERTRIANIPIGCPATTGESGCHPCAGGWPGTKASSEDLIKAAQKGILIPERLGCGTLEAQGKFLLKHFQNGGTQNSSTSKV